MHAEVVFMAMKKIMLSVSSEMLAALERERKTRKLETVPEVIRFVLAHYFGTETRN